MNTTPLVSTGQRASRGGQKLHTVEYWPVKGQPKAIVVFHHGLVEHSGRYTFTGNSYAENGIAFASYDCYNHGRSESQDPDARGFIDNFQQLVDDMLDYATEVHQRADTSTPLFLHGHSMGGLVAASASLLYKGPCHGLLLNSPLINVEWNMVMRIQASMAGLLARMAPRAKIVPAAKPVDMSQDPEVVKAILKDPLNVHGDIRVKTSYTLMEAFTAFTSSYTDIKVPVFATHGDSDNCCSLLALQTFIGAISSSDKSLEVVKGGYHELLHGPEKEEVMQKILTWIEKHIPVQLPANL
mmetsp:Transcript_16217/g.45203  ORF Transcript_16217/g.45203 Transcript_16217/m.45203 type:complete len:298 (-) Transcript_16217:1676-2569(-)